MNRHSKAAISGIGLLVLVGGLACTPRQPPADDGLCDPLASDCVQGQACERFADGQTRCAATVIIAGRVIDLSTQSPIAGALVQATDINGAALGTSAVTDSEGAFALTVPAARDDQGAPVEGVYTLRAQASSYQEFPTAIRPALPLDAISAVENDEGWVIENALTTVGLIGLPGDTTLLGSISGAIDAAIASGILVVAEGNAGAYVGFSDESGAYTIFNVPAGSYSVKGYAAGVQLDTATLSVDTGETVGDVNLTQTDAPLSTLSGNVQIVNAPGGSITSVVLAVESTFDETATRGQVPPGLRVGNVSGAFEIENIPDGRYVVLAAFENDNLVRDPDENISGTQIVHIEVPDPATGNTIAISEGFKITEALAVIEPGADGPEQVDSTTPTFIWADDSSEDGYTVRVFDAFGTQIWDSEIASVSGGDTVSLAYAGPALQPEMFYQFRAISFRERSGSRSAISTTEDLKGVFFYLTP